MVDVNEREVLRYLTGLAGGTKVLKLEAGEFLFDKIREEFKLDLPKTEQILKVLNDRRKLHCETVTIRKKELTAWTIGCTPPNRIELINVLSKHQKMYPGKKWPLKKLIQLLKKSFKALVSWTDENIVDIVITNLKASKLIQEVRREGSNIFKIVLKHPTSLNKKIKKSIRVVEESILEGLSWPREFKYLPI